MVFSDDLGCPLGWKYYHGSCYIVQSDVCKRFEDAEKECEKMQSNLVSIHSRAEDKFVHRQVGFTTAWIGLHDKVKVHAVGT